MVRPTRQGISSTLIGLLALGVGYVFGIIELYVIGAALILLAAGSWLAVALRPPRIAVTRRLSPPLMKQGTPGRVHIQIDNQGNRRSPVVTLNEPIGHRSTATVEVASLTSNEAIAATYRVPTERRGRIAIGPMTLYRRDPFRLARQTLTIAGETSAIITPATVPLPFPTLDSGPLGTRLRLAAQRLGPGEFRALRDYADGDEPRTIHWKASARTDTLKVRQFDMQRLDHCTVVLDEAAASYERASNDRASNERGASDAGVAAAAEAFERAITCAASLVVTASQAEMTTRFVCGAAIDLRGPDVVGDTLRALAEISLSTNAAPTPPQLRSAGDGLGLLIVVTGHAANPMWVASSDRRDPATTALAVCTSGGADAWNTVSATTIDEFQANWERLVGSAGLVGVGVHG